LEALQVAAFLSENYTRLMADDAMDEAAEAAAHLSDSGESLRGESSMLLVF
jgi:hypothetical protein